MQNISEYRATIHLLNKCNEAYYSGGTPPLTDEQFDFRMKELQAFELASPDSADPDSPTRRVGTALSVGFDTVTRSTPMLSLENTYEIRVAADGTASVEDWLVGIGGGVPGGFCIEPKVDGVAVELEYEDGRLVRASTRGDGLVGDNITENVKTIWNLPHQIDHQDRVVLRGEVYMSFPTFNRLNEELIAAGEDPFANPRNAAAGGIKQLDSRKCAKRHLSILIHGVVPDGSYTHHSQALEWAEQLGFPVVPFWTVSSMLGLETIILELKERLKELEKKGLAAFPIDGAVVKVDSIQAQNRLGATNKVPRWAVAYKYPANYAYPVLKQVVVQVSRNGFLTPVAEFDPVYLDGSTIRRASLHNWENVKALDIRHGDTLILKKGGMVIPDIVGVQVDARKSPVRVEPPTLCPECGSGVEQVGPRVACTNVDCACRMQERLIHFCSKGAMDIGGFGPGTIATLWESGLVRSIPGLYSLTAHQLKTVFGDKTVANLLEALEASKQQPVWRVLVGLGIPEWGKTMFQMMTKRFGGLSRIQTALRDHTVDVPVGIGPVMLYHFHRFFESPKNRELVEGLAAAGLQLEAEPQETPQASTALAGKTFVITGTLSKPREVFAALIESHGGKVSGSVSKKTHYLLCGEDAGSKLAKARSLNVEIIDEARLQSMIQ